MKPSLSIVIPAYNEEGNLEASVDSVRRALAGRIDDYEIIVVDDASQDKTADVLKALSAADPRVIAVRHDKNRGMGASLMDGFRRATKDFVGSFPGDNGLDADSFAEMLKLVGQADIVSYYIANPEFRAWPRRFLSAAYVGLVNLLFGLHQRYYNGHAIYRRDIIQNVPHSTSGHTFLSECLVYLLKSGRTCIEIPTVQHERKFGKTKAFSLGNFAGVVKAMSHLRRTVARLGTNAGPVR